MREGLKRGRAYLEGGETGDGAYLKGGANHEEGYTEGRSLPGWR